MAVQETDGRQTAMRIDMNSDMGESFGRWTLGDDEALLDVVSSANVACGFHAGDPSVMLRTLSYAASRGVMVGAHVAYRDLAGFGRRYVDESPDELKADVMYQIAALEGMARSVGAQVRYVKPHGALYNRIVRDESQAAAVVEAIRSVDASLAILTQPGAVVGRLAAPLFLFCLVEGFTHTRSRKRYFARVYVLSTAMSLLFFFMAFAHVLVRPDGFYPANGMMTTFVILMVMFQGIDWLGRRHIVRGLAALLLPLAWPFLASALSLAVPALATPVGLAAYSVLPAWGTTGDSSWPVLAMGLVLYLFRRNRRGQVLAFAVFYFLYGVVYMGLMASQMPDFAWSQLFTRYYEIYGILAAPLMLCYNGQRGGGHKRLFYAFYPAHIYILYALSWGLYLLLN